MCEGPFCYLQQAVGGAPSGSSSGGLAELAVMFANIAIIIGVGVSTIGLAYAFVIYITSAGDPKSVQRAGRAAKWSVIALLVCVGAWGIKTVLFNMLGINNLY